MQQIPENLTQIKESNINKINKVPLSQISRTLKPKWYRCYIEPKQLRALSKRSDFHGLFQALGHLGLWAITGTAT